MHRGVIKCFGRHRGFGFIQRSGGDPDIWFHASDSPDTPEAEFKPGCRVEFSVFHTMGTAHAVSVRVLSDDVRSSNLGIAG